MPHVMTLNDLQGWGTSQATAITGHKT